MQSIIESLLFVSGSPIGVKKIAKIVGKSVDEVKQAIDMLDKDYKENNRGFRVVKKEDEAELVSAPEYKDYINKLVKSDLEEDLSRAALEVLAVIAYRGPIARSLIEEIRGVNCSFTLRNLLMRGLIERVENPSDSRSYLYKISFDFLKHLGLGNIEELPDYKELMKDSRMDNNQ